MQAVGQDEGGGAVGVVLTFEHLERRSGRAVPLTPVAPDQPLPSTPWVCCCTGVPLEKLVIRPRSAWFSHRPPPVSVPWNTSPLHAGARLKDSYAQPHGRCSPGRSPLSRTRCCWPLPEAEPGWSLGHSCVLSWSSRQPYLGKKPNCASRP